MWALHWMINLRRQRSNSIDVDDQATEASLEIDLDRWSLLYQLSIWRRTLKSVERERFRYTLTITFGILWIQHSTRSPLIDSLLEFSRVIGSFCWRMSSIRRVAFVWWRSPSLTRVGWMKAVEQSSSSCKCHFNHRWTNRVRSTILCRSHSQFDSGQFERHVSLSLSLSRRHSSFLSV